MGEYLCSNCFSRLSYDVNNICLVCTRPSYNSLTHPKCRNRNKIEGAFSCLVFDNVTRKLVHQFKYEPYLSSLAPFMSDLIYDALIQNEEFSSIQKSDFILAPIPLSQKKYRSRGYNQSELISKELSKKFGWKTMNLLNRIKNTKTQVGLAREERQSNIHGAFEISKKFNSKIKGANIILVDDIVTTGSTFNEATLVLKKAGAGKIWGIAFAKED